MFGSVPPPNAIRVCHLASGDLWAGAEAQIAMLLSKLSKLQGFKLSVVLLNSGRLAEELEKEEIPVTILDENRLSSFQILRRFISYLIKGHIDILHIHGYKQNILGCIAAQVSSVKATIKTVHGLEEPFYGIKRYKSMVYAYLDRIFSGLFIDMIITVSHDIQSELAKCMKTHRIVTIHNGIDPERVKSIVDREIVRRDLGIGPNTTVIGTAGRVVPVKGLNYFLGTAKLILTETKDVKFLIVGDGPSLSQLEVTARENGLGNSVIFTGYRSDIYELINAMDIFVLSSLHEGIPTVLLEAIFLHKAIVATAVGGIPEIITDGVSGFLVPPKDVPKLAERIIHLIRNPSEAESLAQRAKAQVERNYTTCHQAKKVSLLYTNIN
jgi:L-malate glycosyltransferase